MSEFFLQIGKVIFMIGLGVASLFGYEQQDNTVGAIQPAADYSSSLVTSISSSASSLTVVSTSTASGEHLTPGRVYGLKLGGREYVIGTLSAAKTFSNLTRGISSITGTTTAGVAESWGRGTSVEITTAPILLEISNKISGMQDFDARLHYASTVSSCTADTCLISFLQANNIANQGAGTSTQSNGGIVELATAIEQASTTNFGVLKPTVQTTWYSTSTPTSACDGTSIIGALCNVIARNSGKIHQLWIDLTENFTWTGLHTFNAGVVNSGGIVSNGSATISSLRISTTTASASSTVFALDGNKDIIFYHPQVIATYWATSTYQLPNTTGNQTITHSLGRVPKMVEITASSYTTNAGATAISRSYGFATSTATGEQVAVTDAISSGTDEASFSDSKKGVIIYLIDEDGVVDAEATLTAISNTTVVINWTTNNNNVNRNRHFILKLQ